MAKNNEGFDRICFLNQAAEYVAVAGNEEEGKLGCYLQFIGREIGLKHQVSTPGWEAIKRKRCKKCFISLNHSTTATFKSKKKHFKIVCNNCKSCDGKSYPISNKIKTHYEKLMYEGGGE